MKITRIIHSSTGLGRLTCFFFVCAIVTSFFHGSTSDVNMPACMFKFMMIILMPSTVISVYMTQYNFIRTLPVTSMETANSIVLSFELSVLPFYAVTILKNIIALNISLLLTEILMLAITFNLGYVTLKISSSSFYNNEKRNKKIYIVLFFIAVLLLIVILTVLNLCAVEYQGSNSLNIALGSGILTGALVMLPLRSHCKKIIHKKMLDSSDLSKLKQKPQE